MPNSPRRKLKKGNRYFQDFHNMPKERFKITPASYLILINNKNEILLSLRQNTGYRDGQYVVPSGHVEEGESFAACMIREAKEEANIDIKSDDLKLAHVLHRKEGDNEEADNLKRQRMDIFFSADKWTGEIKNNEPNKCAHLKWFLLDSPPTNIFPYVKFAIEQSQSGIVFSEYGFEN